MKAYTLDKPGIACRAGKIRVGESGRGRKLVEVPLPPAAELASDLAGQPAAEHDTLVSCEGPETSALVLIPDQSGFRGSWRLLAARTPGEWDSIVAGECPPDSMFADEAERQKRAAWLEAHPELPPSAKVIAEGYCAQGDAGRMGGGPAYLLVLKHGQTVEIVRSGRLYGAPSVIRLECVAGAIVLSHPREEAETRAASARWDALADAAGGEPTEIVLSWGGGAARVREENWAKRPILVDAAGTQHVFDGRPIDGVVAILADESVTSGYANGRVAAYRVALAAGVVYAGNEIPACATEQTSAVGWFTSAMEQSRK